MGEFLNAPGLVVRAWVKYTLYKNWFLEQDKNYYVRGVHENARCKIKLKLDSRYHSYNIIITFQTYPWLAGIYGM